MLQVKMSVLKEEKRLLILKLKEHIPVDGHWFFPQGVFSLIFNVWYISRDHGFLSTWLGMGVSTGLGMGFKEMTTLGFLRTWLGIAFGGHG